MMLETSSTPDVPPSAAPLDFESLRYPAEATRFAMAVVCVVCAIALAVLVLATIDAPSLIFGGIGFALLLTSVWVALQFGRIRLLGDAILVTSDTFPVVQNAVDEVRGMLHYGGRVDIFVVPNLPPGVQLSSYFGIRALLIEGGAIADMTGPASRPQLLFLLGTYFGTLKAKHDRWAVAELVLDSAGVRTILAPFVAPWLRATVYTGDRIAFACSGDFQASLGSVYRVLVGKELSAQLAASGLILQAGRVSRSPILRIAELLRPVPHATNRFLNVLRFAQQTDPDSALAFRSELSPEVNIVLDEALAKIAHQGRAKAGVIAVTVGAIAMTTILSTLPLQVLVESPGTTPDPSVSPEVLTVQSLIDAVPTAVAHSCDERGAPPPESPEGLVAAVGCLEGGVDLLSLYAYEPSSFGSALDYWVAGSVEAPCADGGSSAWTDSDGLERGVLTCFETDSASFAVWSYETDAVLVVAHEADMNLEELYAWWQRTTAELPFQ